MGELDCKVTIDMKRETHIVLLPYILAILLISAIPFNGYGQNVTKADFRQAGDKVIISYHLSKKADVAIYVSTDYGETFTGPLYHVSGDVGKDVQAGDRSILWDPIAEYGGITGSGICFKIIAKNHSNHSSSSTSSRTSGTRIEDDPFVRFGIGAAIGMMPLGDEAVVTWHIPVEVLIGRNNNTLNFAIGETFSFFKNTVQFTTLATLRAKISILYAGIGGGLNVNIYTDEDGFMEAYDEDFIDYYGLTGDIYENIYGDFDEIEIPDLPKINGVLQIETGITTRHYDMSLFYRYDFYGLSEFNLPGTFGLAFKYYF